MSDADEEIEAIRERKRQRLRERLEAGEGAGSADPGGEKRATPSEPVHVDGADHLRELVSAHDPVLVDFHADWCGPCRMLAPVVETLAAETPAAVAKVDADAHQELAARYGVQGLPTLLLFAGGEVAERAVGMQDEQQLRALIERHA